VPFELLPAVAEAVAGRTEVYVDSGVRSGGDVVAAVALGATGVMVGRAYLYGLMVGGQRGVTHVLDLLTDEMQRAMGMLGTPTLTHLSPEHARLRDR
jgi:L-lactate dehydrogenase (cytochrome)